MIRNNFNGGIISPSMILRADLDNYKSSCRHLLNFDIMETGGITKRRGFHLVTNDADFSSNREPITTTKDAALFIFNASDDQTHLVVVDYEHNAPQENLIFKVYHVDEDDPTTYTKLFEQQLIIPGYQPLDMREMKATQINNIMLFTHPLFPIVELGIRSNSTWYVQRYKFKHQPWKDEEIQDHPITVKKVKGGYSAYDYTGKDVTFQMTDGLRVSRYIEDTEIEYDYDAVTAKIKANIYNADELATKATFYPGKVFAFVRPANNEKTYWICREDFTEDLFVQGFIDPQSYPAVFSQIQNGTTAEQPVADIWYLSQSICSPLKLSKGKIFTFNTSYYEFWTAYKDLAANSGCKDPADRPDVFSRGMLLGYASCKDKWTFVNSGTWYGQFQVRACYEGQKNNFTETGFIEKEWEKRGEVFSKVGNPVNQEIGGDESLEECWIGLFLYNLRDFGNSTLGFEVRSFPGDECDIRLTVNSYKHDLEFDQSSNGLQLKKNFDHYSEPENAEFPEGGITTEYWSEPAFSTLNGFPTCSCLLDQRLVFAGTTAQPMTVWMSQTNDINNFDITEGDNSALALTIASDTQEPIRWMASQRGRLMVGTSQGEFVIDAGDGGAITNSNATCIQHGFNGSERVGCIMCDDSVIYMAKGGIRAKRYGYSEDVDGYVSTDLNVYADHIFKGLKGVKQIAVQKTPYNRLYFVTGTGNMRVLTYNARHNVMGWTQYSTNLGDFTSVANMQHKNKYDQLFCIIKGTDGVCKVYTSGIDATDYRDENREYVCQLETTILSSTEIGGRKQNVNQIMLYIGEKTPAKGLYITTDSFKDLVLIPDADTKTLEVGWHSDLGFASHDYETTVGFQSISPNGLTILALQAK